MSNVLSNEPSQSQKVKTTRTSVSAVSSMIFGIMSPVVLCTCLPAIVTSALAVILGHVALYKISRGQGAVLGKRHAITGLILGYLFLVLSILLAPRFFTRIELLRELRMEAVDNTSDAMWAAERKIVSDREGSAHGNSPEAKRLALAFSRDLEARKRQVLVRMRSGKVEEREESFVTYCQLNQDSICFLVHIPEYRKYDEGAKETIEEIAWLAARSTVDQSSLPSDAELGVGLKGLLLYGSTLKGRAFQRTPTTQSDDRTILESFFNSVDEPDLDLDIQLPDSF